MIQLTENNATRQAPRGILRGSFKRSGGFGQTMKGRKKGYNHTEEEKQNISKSLKGKRVSPKTEFKKGHGNKNNPQQGDKNNNWKGGISSRNLRIRASLEYKLWRQAIFKRDNYTCIWCGSTKNIQVDHIKSFSLFPELRFAIDNGRTLCFDCHKTTGNYAGKSNSIKCNQEVYKNAKLPKWSRNSLSLRI